MPYLNGLLVEKRGVTLAGDNSTLNCCLSCYAPLFKRTHPRKPDLAIANDMFIGEIPEELKDLTIVEEAMIARRRAKCCILHLKETIDEGGYSNGSDSYGHCHADTQRGIRGHFIIFPSYPERITLVLPRSVDDIVRYMCVVFVGSNRPTQEWLKEKAKPLSVRRERIKRALIWLRDNNDLYKDIKINYEALNSLPDEFVPPVNVDVQEENELESFLSSSYDPIQQVVPPKAPQNLDKDIYSSVIVSDVDGKEVSSIEMASTALQHLKAGGKFVQMPHGVIPSNDYQDYNLFPLLYPTLYPYGKGGFNSPDRIQKVSPEVHARHLFNLHDDHFQTHYSFPFAIFNVLQRHSVSRHASVRVKSKAFMKFCSDLNAVPMQDINNIVQQSASSKNGILNAGNEHQKTILKLMSQISLIQCSRQHGIKGENEEQNSRNDYESWPSQFLHNHESDGLLQSCRQNIEWERI